MRLIPDFMIDATNVYRTKLYIVKQCMGIQIDNMENNAIKSYDTFYKRTKQRDKEFELIFKDRKNINGKRLPTTMYTKIYVD